MLPTKTTVQTLLFLRKPAGGPWTVKTAKAWAKKHDKKYGNVDVTDDYIHLRQREPEEFQTNSMRTIEFGKDIKAVVGRPWVAIIDNPHPKPKHNARVLFKQINDDWALHHRKHEIYNKLGRLKALNKFDRNRAKKSLNPLVLAASKKYRRLHKIPAKAITFSLDDMSEAKEILVLEFLKEWQHGQLDYTIPKSAWQKGRRYK